jgi:pimeloyl-ACP methyl ester carboxylesterase
MQMAYQFPERCERLVLVSSGGLGRELHPLLRAATLPGAEWVLPVIASARLMDAGRALGRGLGLLGLKAGTDVAEIARGHASLSDREARAAFLHTLRTLVDPGGQRVDASDRLYLAEHVPFLLVWGARDSVIPVEHAYAAHELVKSSRLEVFEEAGHFPQLDEPERFIDVLGEFMDSTEPAKMVPEEWRALLRR